MDLPAPARADVVAWRVARTFDTALSAVVAPARDDVWVFGDGPVAHRWNGRDWRAVAVPGLAGHRVVSASASSVTNVWACTDRSAVLRWDGGGWTVAREGQGPVSVVALGDEDVWVFGETTWRFDGRGWSRADVGVRIAAADAVSPTDIWGCVEGLVVRFGGNRWQALKRIVVPGEGRLRKVVPDGRGGAWTLQRDGVSSTVRHMSASGEWALVVLEGAGEHTVHDLARRPGSPGPLGVGAGGALLQG